MKKKLFFGILLSVLVFVTVCATVMISANDVPQNEIVTPQATFCDVCGPYTLRCTEIAVDDDLEWHSFSYGGYPKTCYYYMRQVYTRFTCNVCGSNRVFENTFHSHGERGHTPSQCGRANTHLCYLDGTVYNEIPAELLSFEISLDELQELSQQTE